MKKHKLKLVIIAIPSFLPMTFGKIELLKIEETVLEAPPEIVPALPDVVKVCRAETWSAIMDPVKMKR